MVIFHKKHYFKRTQAVKSWFFKRTQKVEIWHLKHSLEVITIFEPKILTYICLKMSVICIFYSFSFEISLKLGGGSAKKPRGFEGGCPKNHVWLLGGEGGLKIP